MFRRSLLFHTLLFVVASLAGCGSDAELDSDRPQPVPVSGTVLYNQQPVAGATIVFHPEGGAHAATAQTDDSGDFRLQTFAPNDGAVPGEYKVTVRKVEVQSGGEEEMSQIDAPSPPEQRSLLPERYGNPESTDLKASVGEGGNNDLEFKLQD